jgi:hypothetical protein
MVVKLTTGREDVHEDLEIEEKLHVRVLIDLPLPSNRLPCLVSDLITATLTQYKFASSIPNPSLLDHNT